jgi:hypothetical protein
MWGNILKGLAILVAGGLVAYGTYKIYKKITAREISQAVKEKCPAAFSAIIKEKKRNAVNVGIFDSNNKEIGEMTVKSQEGVDSSLREGQMIYVF